MWEIRVYSLIGIGFSLIIILLDMFLLKKRKINEKGFVFWFIVGVVLGLFSAVPPLFTLFSFVFGTEFLLSGILATGFLFFLLAIFYLHYRISEIHSLLMKLAMEVSVAKYSQKKKKKKKE